MFAIISDIHSNIEALTTVLKDIEDRGIKKIYCLGDVVGYGPDPKPCLDHVLEKTEFCVIGNHDYGVVYEPTNFNVGAEKACFWTRQVLEANGDSNSCNKHWQFLGTQPMRRSLELKFPKNKKKVKLDFVHASPRRPINEYVFPDDVYTNPNKIKLLFEKVDHICFIGHTHLPGVFLDEPDFYAPDELGDVYPITDDEKAIVNVGSVGQPRDGDSRASYVYIEENKVHFIRLEYDIESVVKKIEDIPELDNFHAERLFNGR